MSEALEAALKAVIYKEIPNDTKRIMQWLKENQCIPGIEE